MPAVPGSSELERIRRYMTSPWVLIAARGAAAAMIDTGIINPFRGHQCACGDQLRRCTDALYIPSSAAGVDDRHVVGCRERGRTVHARLRSAIEASQAEPTHHRSSALPRLPARHGRATAVPCSIVRHKPTTRAPLEPNKPHQSGTGVASSHLRHMYGSTAATEHRAADNSSRTDTHRPTARFISTCADLHSAGRAVTTIGSFSLSGASLTHVLGSVSHLRLNQLGQPFPLDDRPGGQPARQHVQTEQGVIESEKSRSGR